MFQFLDLSKVGRFGQLLLLTAATFAATYGRFTLGSLQETIRLDLELNDSHMAWLQGPAMAIPMALASIPIGLMVDRFSRARLFIVFAALSLAATAITAVASSMVVLFLARCLAGLASAATLIAAFSVIGDLYAPAQRGRATMVATMGEIGGAPAAFGLGGILLTVATSTSSFSLEGWRLALIWMCAPALLVMLLLTMLREPVRTDIRKKGQLVGEAWPQLWRYRAMIVPLLLARIMVWIADGAVMVWAAPTFNRMFGLAPDKIGAIMATVLLFSGVLGPVLGGPLADFCQKSGGARRTVATMSILALLSSPMAFFGLMPDVALASLMLGGFLTLGFVIGTAALTVATIVIPGELRGLYLALNITVGATFAIGVSPLIVSSLSAALGGPEKLPLALVTVCATTSLLGAAVFGCGARYFPRPTPESSYQGHKPAVVK